MGTVTTLSGISLTPTEDNAGETYGEDMIGMLQCAQVKALELINMLNTIAGRLPNGDSNIATINTIVSNLG